MNRSRCSPNRKYTKYLVRKVVGRSLTAHFGRVEGRSANRRGQFITMELCARLYSTKSAVRPILLRLAVSPRNLIRAKVACAIARIDQSECKCGRAANYLAAGACFGDISSEPFNFQDCWLNAACVIQLSSSFLLNAFRMSFG
jgi:hypothetical protein